MIDKGGAAVEGVTCDTKEPPLTCMACSREKTPDGQPMGPTVIWVRAIRMALCEGCRRDAVDEMLKTL